MSLNKTIWQEALTQYKAWNEAKFVHKVLTAGQKSPAEKWQEFLDMFSFGRKIKPQPSLWEQKRKAEELATYYKRIQQFEEWRKKRGSTS